MNLMITGGAGFIGINLVKYWLKYHPSDIVVVYDKLTYAANTHEILNMLKKYENLYLHYGDICDTRELTTVFNKYKIDGVIHLAAESHVDNSIETPMKFTQTNIVGTHTLLEVCKYFWGESSNNKFIHVSTDEIYGSLNFGDPLFTEESQINPSSPYSASKAGSDGIALAYAKTYDMNIIVTNCSNNYGPFQHDEKLIPTLVRKAVNGEPLPIYGTGENIRDWIYVEDHCAALDAIFHKSGLKGERFNIGSYNEKTNLEMAEFILGYLGKSFDLIEMVEDRKGHDFRYGINSRKLQDTLGWSAKTEFNIGLKKTINWYKEKYDGKF